jgi:hypothetical protein
MGPHLGLAKPEPIRGQNGIPFGTHMGPHLRSHLGPILGPGLAPLDTFGWHGLVSDALAAEAEAFNDDGAKISSLWPDRRNSDMLHPSVCEICYTACDARLLLWCWRCDRDVCPRCTSRTETDCCVECQHDARWNRIRLRSARRGIAARLAMYHADGTLSEPEMNAQSESRSRSRSPRRHGADGSHPLPDRRNSDMRHPSDCEICQNACDETLLLWCRRCDRSVCPRCTSQIVVDCCVECEDRLRLRSLRRAIAAIIARYQADGTILELERVAQSEPRSRSRSPSRGDEWDEVCCCSFILCVLKQTHNMKEQQGVCCFISSVHC